MFDGPTSPVTGVMVGLRSQSSTSRWTEARQIWSQVGSTTRILLRTVRSLVASFLSHFFSIIGHAHRRISTIATLSSFSSRSPCLKTTTSTLIPRGTSTMFSASSSPFLSRSRTCLINIRLGTRHDGKTLTPLWHTIIQSPSQGRKRDRSSRSGRPPS